MPNILKHSQWISLNTGLIVVYSDLFPVSNIFQVKYSLQNLVRTQKPFNYHRNKLKSRLNIQKSIKKQVKSISKYPRSLFFRIDFELSIWLIKLNPWLCR